MEADAKAGTGGAGTGPVKGAGGGRRSRLRWAFGCLTVAVLLVALVFVVFWQGLSSWDEEASPWEHLPAETLWAVRIHDVQKMGKAAFKDQGIRSLIEKAAEGVRPPEAGGGAFPVDWREFVPVNAVRFYDYFGFLHKAVAPNSVVVGATARDPAAAFMIMYPPAWMRFLLNWSGESLDGIHGADAVEADDQPLYFAERDGWLLSSAYKETLREVLDGWNGGAFPLGPDSGRIDAHVYAAARAAADGDEGGGGKRAPEDEAPPVHFTLADPFAGVPLPGVSGLGEARREKPLARLLLTPGKEGEWLVSGEARVWGEVGGDYLAEAVHRALGERVPVVVPPPERDFALFMRMADDVWNGFKDEVDALTPERDPSRAHPVRALAARWVADAWLGNAGREWTALAAAPAVARGDLPYPVMPVFSLGWRVPDGLELARAGETFGRGLEHWLEATTAPGGPFLVQQAKRAFAHSRVEAGPGPGLGGELTVPAVAVNGARPAWRFVEDGQGGGMGWIASDPSGLPGDAAGEREVFSTMAEPPSGHTGLAAGWRVGAGFSRAFLEWTADRFELLRRLGVRVDLADGVDLRDVLSWLAEFAAVFPKGSFAGDLEMSDERLVFMIRVSPGVAPAGSP